MAPVIALGSGEDVLEGSKATYVGQKMTVLSAWGGDGMNGKLIRDEWPADVGVRNNSRPIQLG